MGIVFGAGDSGTKIALGRVGASADGRTATVIYAGDAEDDIRLGNGSFVCKLCAVVGDRGDVEIGERGRETGTGTGMSEGYHVSSAFPLELVNRNDRQQTVAVTNLYWMGIRLGRHCWPEPRR